jgi:hypothetical protein
MSANPEIWPVGALRQCRLPSRRPDIAALVIILVTGTLIGVVRFLWSRP